MQTEVYESGDYRNYFNLVSHHSERKTGDIFHRAMFTIFLLRFSNMSVSWNIGLKGQGYKIGWSSLTCLDMYLLVETRAK